MKPPVTKQNPVISHSFTVGIPTCYGENQLVKTVKSIRNSKNVTKDFEVIIVADRVKIAPKIRQDLAKLNVTLVENDLESSAFAKDMQILSLAKSDIIVFTHDDVLFQPHTLNKVIKAFDDEQNTFVGVANTPLTPNTFLESIISVGIRITTDIAKNWNKGDNYLACFGRVMAFKTNYIQSMKVIENVVSLDAYLYLENKRLGGKYKCIWEDPVYFRAPQKLKEHLRKSSRFQSSQQEMQMYRRFNNLECEYKIPKRLVAKSAFQEFTRNPQLFILYAGIFVYTRIRKIHTLQAIYANWDVEISTKNIA